MKKLMYGLFGGPLRLGGPPGPLDKTALLWNRYLHVARRIPL